MTTLPHLFTISSVTPAALIALPHGIPLIPADMAAPLLVCLPDGEALFLENWTDQFSQPFRVPAGLVAAVRSALGLSRVDA